MPESKDEIRCIKCRKLLGYCELKEGKVSIKCKCGTMNTVQASQPKVEKFIYNTPYQNRMNLVRKES